MAGSTLHSTICTSDFGDISQFSLNLSRADSMSVH
jgi:hypothetical protein